MFCNIIRSFFGQGEMFRTAHVYRTRSAAGGQPREDNGGTTPHCDKLESLGVA